MAFFTSSSTNGLLTSTASNVGTSTAHIAAAAAAQAASSSLGPAKSGQVQVERQDRMEIDDSVQVSVPTARLGVDETVQRASSEPLQLKSQHRVGYVYDDAMMMHAPANEHPEMPGRIAGIYSKLNQNRLLNYMKRIPIRKVKKMESLLVHSEDHWDKVEAIQYMNKEDIIASASYYEHLSLYVCESTTRAALLSCGGTIEAALAVARGELSKTLAIVRPPGHHAEPDEHMGFCFFNNVAVAARVVQQLTPLKRILILDWDVHHGNGTQRAFYDDPSILYVSIHRFDGGEFYPGGPFGGLDQCGVENGLGTSVNVPWPDGGMGDADYLHAFMRIVMPIAMEFAPELVLVSAGFDAAQGDELGECNVSPAGYAHMTHMLSSLAGGRVVVALEGGYNIESISNSTLAVAKVLLGESPPEMARMTASELATETVWAVATHQSKYWKSIDTKAVEPPEELEDMSVSLPELLKTYRQDYLFSTYKLAEIPLIEPLEDRFNLQLMCTQDLLDNETVVLFVHQFGNLRVELTGSPTFQPNMELSYLVDVSRKLIEWIKSKGFAYVEVNTYPKPVANQLQRRPTAYGDFGREVLTYVWDNYVDLSKAKNIIVIGHGPACESVMQLLSSRVHNMTKRVKAVCMVVGHNTVPRVPREARELRDWYLTHSLVVVPKDHMILIEEQHKKVHGRIMQFDELRAVKLFSFAFPDITQFLDEKLVAE